MALPFSTIGIGCAWAFYGLAFCVGDADYERLPKFLRKIFEVLSFQPFLLWLTTSFLVLCYAGWQPMYFWIYLLPGLPYAGISFIFYYFIRDLGQLNPHKPASWAIISLFGVLFGIASFLLLLIMEKFIIELAFFNILYSLIGFVLGYVLIIISVFREKLRNYGINLTVFAKFLAGNLIGLGINLILS